MRRFSLFLATLLPAMLFAGCSGNTGTQLANEPPGSSLPAVKSSSGMEYASRLFHFRSTPNHPPRRRHKVTPADRARALAGGWTPVTNKPPVTNGADTQELMTDGTVMVLDYCTSQWYALTPDNTGSYINGTWVKVPAMPSNYGPLYFASAVLADGKLIVQGGEYNGGGCARAETTLGAIYDPFAKKWTAVSPPTGWAQIGDGQSAVLSNGTYMLGNCCTSSQAQLDESSMTWTIVGTGKHDTNSEEGWALLRNGDILTADVGAEPASEVFNPGTSMWSSAGTIPVNLTSGFEIGPETLRPNNTVWIAGASGLSAIYNAAAGTWSTGPTFPVINGSQVDTADAPSSMLTNGNVMVAASPGLYNAPATFYLFNGSTLTSIATPPNAPNDSSYNIRLLMLPTGQIMQTDDSADVEIYAGTSKIAKGTRPTITSVPSTLTHGNTYVVKGRKFNGVSQNNMYGDDVQQATNYPLVRIKITQTGHVFYCRTHGHSYMGVGSSRPVSTSFDVPSGIETGAASLVVVVNGVASAAVNVTIN
jgi:hypothetical protein